MFGPWMTTCPVVGPYPVQGCPGGYLQRSDGPERARHQGPAQRERLRQGKDVCNQGRN